MRDWISAKFTAHLAKARRFGAALGLILAVALAAGAVVGSFLIPTKALGVAVSAVGCFAVGWLFSVFFGRALGLAKKDGADEKFLRDELAREQSENATARRRISALESDNARLMHQRIDINSFAPVLKLGLMEVDMSIKDVKAVWMDDFDSGGMFSKPTRSKYVGVLERSFKATYGVDLMKLRIHDDGDCLRVAGIAPESIGLKDDSMRWLVRQTQKYRLKATSLVKNGSVPSCDHDTGWGDGETYFQIDASAPFEGRMDLNATATVAEEQTAELQKRINNGIGQEFKLVNDYIQKTAQGFISLLLAPVGKPIVFVSTPLMELKSKPNWLVIEDFVSDFNNRLPNGTEG